MVLSFSHLKLAHKLIVVFIIPIILTAGLSIYFYQTGILLWKNEALVVIVLYTILLSITLLIGFSLINKISTSASIIADATNKLSTGELNQSIDVDGAVEISSIALHLNKLKDDLQAKINFADSIVLGNLQANYKPSQNDQLGKALVHIQKDLVKAKREDEKRNWTTEALGKFVEVLRSDKDLVTLANEVIINLVKILRANQGAIFIVSNDNEEICLELKACYAYNRTKYITQKLAPGEGIIGQVYLEKEFVYLKDVPVDFVRITSGLGEATPKNILITPLIMNEDVIGVIELASFQAFEEHEIEFVQKIGESIAHTLSSFKVAENTKRLLTESQHHTEQMRAQEEELRQNQEELQATQEEISRKYDALFTELIALNYQSRFDQLKSIISTKKRNIEYYFTIIRNQIKTFAENRMIIEAVKAFKEAYYNIEAQVAEPIERYKEDVRKYYETEFIPRLKENTEQIESVDKYLPVNSRPIILQYLYISNNPHPTGSKSLLDNAGDQSEYSKIHQYYHPIIRSFLEKFGYYDIFLLDGKTGEILYSVFKEVDFGTSLTQGLYHDTNFGHVVKEAIESKDKEFIRLIDFEFYDPSYRTPASFIACPIYEGNEKVGIVVFQMPINRINQILTGDNHWKEDGLGESGETFMVGKDYKIRSVSRGLIENKENYLSSLRNIGYDAHTIHQIAKTNTSILLEDIKLSGVLKALQGTTGTHIERNKYGVEVLTAFAPLDIPDVDWVILSLMKEEEASKRINNLRNTNTN